MDEDIEFCTCENCTCVSTEFSDWYEWDVCSNCGKLIEGSIRSLDHYDGEDHVIYFEDLI